LEDCIFCKIANKEIPAKLIYENDDVIAFPDIDPQAPVHILIVPKRHIPSLLDVKDNEMSLLSRIQEAVLAIAKEFNLEDRGFRIVNNCKEEGGQTVEHLHFHFLAKRQMQWPPG
jgi:histidine triad (HIT) family protein